ncbi:venom metalloproteinase 3-like [Aphidius gifuensis]|nr:venom metalloproteinase 3-like [Aphidius gifuensis]
MMNSFDELIENEIREEKNKLTNINEEDNEITGFVPSPWASVGRLHSFKKYKKSGLPEKYKNEILNFNESLPLNFTIPKKIYPEILIVVDYNIYEKFEYNSTKAILYILTFWNSVDLKFRRLENPSFSLNIVGIIFASDENSLIYLLDNNDSNNEDELLEKCGIFWFKYNHIIPVDSYDIVITMTSSSLPNRKLGLSYHSGACHYDNGKKIMKKIGIIQDQGGYDGIQTAVETLARLFGSNYDDERIKERNCPFNDGFIMSNRHLTINSSDFSKCSLKDFQKFLNSNPSCLYNEPIIGNKIPRYLPGKLQNHDNQCKKIEGTKSCPVPSNHIFCQQLKCIEKGSKNNCKAMTAGAADGTLCEENSHCLHNRCIINE